MIIDNRLKQNSKKNVIYFSVKSESQRHYLKKAEFCYYLKLLDLDFWTEARINPKSRCDIFIPELEVAVEILDSENEENLESKVKNYGCIVRGVSCMQELDLDFVEKLIN
jgi:hypothetical protein